MPNTAAGPRLIAQPSPAQAGRSRKDSPGKQGKLDALLKAGANSPFRRYGKSPRAESQNSLAGRRAGNSEAQTARTVSTSRPDTIFPAGQDSRIFPIASVVITGWSTAMKLKRTLNSSPKTPSETATKNRMNT